MTNRLVILYILLIGTRIVDGITSGRLMIGSFLFQSAPSYATRRLVCTPRLVKTSEEATDPSFDPIKSKSTHQCRFCDSTFSSRNALFRHVRSDPVCSRLANDGKPYSYLKLPKRQKIALQFQYFSVETESPDICTFRSEAEVAGDTQCTAVQQAIDSFVRDDLALDVCNAKILSKTQSSVSNLRHCSLGQEKDCPAAADVMVVSFVAPSAVSSIDPDRDDPDQQLYFLNSLVKYVNDYMEKTVESTGLNVKLLACKLLSSDSRLHAERSCTQRVYHYLMPLQWLPEGSELEQWWLQCEEETLLTNDHANHHTLRVQTHPPNDSLRLLKNALRSAECATVTAADKVGRDAVGRFGTLANKLRRPWHNFADPVLRGDASPNNEPVWRVVDRARLIQLETWNGRVFATLEFRGDDFLPEQVRRIVGTALAVTHGWLPSKTFDLLTQPDVFLEAPLAPEGHLYLAAVRFHFDELRTSGQGIFDTEADGPVIRTTQGVSGSIQQHLLMNLSGEAVQRKEALWLEKLRDTVAPRMNEEFKLSSRGGIPLQLKTTSAEKLNPPPDCYTSTLSLLRDIIATGKWPATSAARSTIIREANAKKGSFTVVNPAFQKERCSRPNDPLPLGNILFPSLVRAVFDLEQSLSERELEYATADNASLHPSSHNMQKRLPSSHCAVNCNAEFTPHVDSGLGAGQSLSMIVGLGDYVGGELAVEGKAHDIRYRPLEFDGWKLRHWTLPFRGERFSLVWFTPEVKGNE